MASPRAPEKDAAVKRQNAKRTSQKLSGGAAKLENQSGSNSSSPRKERLADKPDIAEGSLSAEFSKAQDRQRVIIVLCMHRSGSSVITRGIQALGADLGDNLMAPVDGNNAKGFFEDLDIYRFNEELLSSLGSAWHSLTPLDKTRLTGPEFSEQRRQAIQLMNEKLVAGRLFAFKDPRTAVLMPFWRCVFEDLDLDDRYVIAVRNPIEIAASLKARDGLDMRRGLYLWAKHAFEAVGNTKGKPRIFVAYDAIMRQPMEQLTRLAEGLGFDELNTSEKDIRDYCEGFLESKLRHNYAGEQELERTGLVPPFLIALDDWLRSCAAASVGDETEPDHAFWEDVQARLREAVPLLTLSDAEFSQAISERLEKQAAEEALADAESRLSSAVSDRDQAIAEVTSERIERHAAEEALADRDKAIMESASSLEENKGLLEGALTELKEERRQHQEVQSLFRREQSIRQSSQDELKVERQERNELEDRVNTAEARAKEAALEAELLQQRVTALATAKQKAEADHDATRTAYLLARAETNSLRSSTSWRLSAPVRALGRIARNPISGTRQVGLRIARLMWRALPISSRARGRVAGAAFATAPFLFSWTPQFKAWRAQRQTRQVSHSSLKSDHHELGTTLDYDGPSSSSNMPFQAPGAASSSDPSQCEDVSREDPSLCGYVPLRATQVPEQVEARALAFYLPQFHPIPENDAWWGEGFTEWTKVRPSRPSFEGHYQPHEPGELGYYDLQQDHGTMVRQAELAELHGLSGFVFYFYWFAGKRLLEEPIKTFANEGSIDFPFCLCWANENWSRRWDGREDHILIGQEHSADDDLAFIEYVARYMRNPRYIRIGGRPLLIVYRPALLPDARATAMRWRAWARDNGIGEIYLACTESFESKPPNLFGFDAAIEFPPNNMGLSPDRSLVPDLAETHELKLYDWRQLAARGEAYQEPEYTLFRSVTPSWDNTPRRPKDGAVFLYSTPTRFRRWLQRAVADTTQRFQHPDERLIFINAWNEWAEGAHLEPDRRYGYAWLEAARGALVPQAARETQKVVVAIHDLHRHGSQFGALNIARTLKNRFGFEVETVAGEDGALSEAFRDVGPLHLMAKDAPHDAHDVLARDLAERGFQSAFINSSAAGWLAPSFSKAGIRILGLVHELPEIIAQMRLEEGLRAFDAYADRVIFAADIVRKGSALAAGLEAWKNGEILPQGHYKADGLASLSQKELARQAVVERLGTPPETRFIIGMGYADHRKGIDRFIEWAEYAIAVQDDVHWVWVGGIDHSVQARVDEALQGRLRGRFHATGFSDETALFLRAGDLYALTSREDPFPTTAIEALAAGTPVVMVAGCGGIEDLTPYGAVFAASDASPEAFWDVGAPLLQDGEMRARAGQAGLEMVRERFGFASYVAALTDKIGLELPAISVVVPNYNYSEHLEERLRSIVEQSLPPREIIILDDASTDNSLEVIERVMAGCDINWRLVCNSSNSGDVFAQWRKGVGLAACPLVWIAEADDVAEPSFLESAVPAFQNEGVVLSFTQSMQIDEQGRVLASDYSDYVRDISETRWQRRYLVDGHYEGRQALSIKNTIPNVSAVVFRREVLIEELDAASNDLKTFRVAGDWRIYAGLAKRGSFAFDPQPLNRHRRHSASVTISRFGLDELAEIARMQKFVAENFAVDVTEKATAEAYLKALVSHFSLDTQHDKHDLDAALQGIT